MAMLLAHERRPGPGGIMGPAQVLDVLGTWGINRVCIAPTNLTTSYVTLYKRGNGDPTVDPGAIVVARISETDSDEKGRFVRVGKLSSRVHYAVVGQTYDAKLNATCGVQIKTIY